MNANLAAVLYLVSGVLFILALRGLSSPTTSQAGNVTQRAECDANAPLLLLAIEYNAAGAVQQSYRYNLLGEAPSHGRSRRGCRPGARNPGRFSRRDFSRPGARSTRRR